MQPARILVAIWLLGLSACGPETIVLKPPIDTAAHHIANGNKLLDQGKLEDARLEFSRAKELDPGDPLVYVGLGLVHGRRGELQQGFAAMEKAEQLATTGEQQDAVEKGYQQLNEMRSQ